MLNGVEANEESAIEPFKVLALSMMGSAPSGTDTVRLNSSFPTEELLLPLFTNKAGSDRPLACAYLYWSTPLLQFYLGLQSADQKGRRWEGEEGGGGEGEWGAICK